VKFKSVVAA